MSIAEQIFSLSFISLIQLELIKVSIQMKSQNEIKTLNWFIRIITKVIISFDRFIKKWNEK